MPQNEQFYVADSMWVNLANVAPAMFFLVDRGGSTFDDGMNIQTCWVNKGSGLVV